MKAGWEVGAALTLVCALLATAKDCVTSKTVAETASMLQVGSIGINLGTVSAADCSSRNINGTAHMMMHFTQNCMKLGYMSREALELGSDNSIWYANTSLAMLEFCSSS